MIHLEHCLTFSLISCCAQSAPITHRTHMITCDYITHHNKSIFRSSWTLTGNVSPTLTSRSSSLRLIFHPVRPPLRSTRRLNACLSRCPACCCQLFLIISLPSRMQARSGSSRPRWILAEASLHVKLSRLRHRFNLKVAQTSVEQTPSSGTASDRRDNKRTPLSS